MLSRSPVFPGARFEVARASGSLGRMSFRRCEWRERRVRRRAGRRRSLSASVRAAAFEARKAARFSISSANGRRANSSSSPNEGKCRPAALQFLLDVGDRSRRPRPGHRGGRLFRGRRGRSLASEKAPSGHRATPAAASRRRASATISWSGSLFEPVRTKRGGRCCRNNSFSGVSSCRTGFWIVAGSLPRKPSSRSMMWRREGRFMPFSIFDCRFSS